jgi:hypothetical protein
LNPEERSLSISSCCAEEMNVIKKDKNENSIFFINKGYNTNVRFISYLPNKSYFFAFPLLIQSVSGKNWSQFVPHGLKFFSLPLRKQVLVYVAQ